MDILFITPSFYPATYYGGPSLSVYYLANEVVKINKNTSVVTTDANGKENLKVDKNVFVKIGNGLNVKYYGDSTSFGFSFKMFTNIHNDIKFSKIIYLVSVFSPSTPLSIFLSFIYKKRVVISPRGQLGEWCLLQGSIFKKLWLKVFIKPYINILTWHATSTQEADRIRQIFPKTVAWVIPNGIDIKEYENIDLKKDRNFYYNYSKNVINDNKIIISMGRIHKKKGFDILIEVFDNLKRKNENYLLFIAGTDYGEKETLMKVINRLNLRDSVFFIGQIEGKEKIDFLKNADVFVLPSHDENYGLVYAEALACGTPIVASKNTPWMEVENNKIGKWVDNDVKSFVRAIEEVISYDDPSMSARCRQFIINNYLWSSIAKIMLEKFEEI